jgi:hypothetical protein
MRLRELGKEARRAVQHDIYAPRQLVRGQVLDRPEIDADELRDRLEGLAVDPRLAARNHRQLARSEPQQLIQCAVVRQDVARNERYFVFAKELLSAQAAGSAGLPVHFEGLGGRFCHRRLVLGI